MRICRDERLSHALFRLLADFPGFDAVAILQARGQNLNLIAATPEFNALRENRAGPGPSRTISIRVVHPAFPRLQWGSHVALPLSCRSTTGQGG